MKFRISYLFLAIVIASLLFTGLDFTHHAHNSWLFFQMIQNWDFMSVNPFFESQITYAYGVPAYALAGLFWFIFDIHTINIIQGITIIINYIILRKLFKKERWVSVLILLNLFFTFYDAYVAAFSNCLFWIATYGYYKKKKWWVIPLLIAAFNHPYVLISSIFFAIKEKSLIIPLSLILTWFLVASFSFSSETFIPIYTMFMGLARIIFNLFPILVLTSYGKMNNNDFKILRDIVNFKVNFPTLLIVILIIGLLAVNLAIYTLVMQPISIVDYTLFEGMPEINGTIRAIDYMYLPSVFVLPYQGYNLEAGSFRENNPQHMIKTVWTSNEEYSDFMSNSTASYVLYCKMCNPQSNEIEILQEYYNLVWENDYYYLFSVI